MDANSCECSPTKWRHDLWGQVSSRARNIELFLDENIWAGSVSIKMKYYNGILVDKFFDCADWWEPKGIKVKKKTVSELLSIVCCFIGYVVLSIVCGFICYVVQRTTWEEFEDSYVVSKSQQSMRNKCVFQHVKFSLQSFHFEAKEYYNIVGVWTA